ncbi:uncharacterized protein [Bos taurus]|uniref:uncharacterized protein n=1 Tax=Bos taurus TaxID=9913 RepID=UPI0028CB8AE0|nr:uncharacterized protein LOC132342862 [Bos taurus]
MEEDAPLLSAKFPGLFHAAPLPAPSPRPLSASPLRQASTSHRQRKQLPSADPSSAASAALNRLPPPAAERGGREGGPNRGDDTTGLPGTFCSSSSPPPPPPTTTNHHHHPPTFNPSTQPPPPHPGLAPPPLGTAPQLPSWAPKSPVRTRWRGSNFLLAPPTPPKRRRRRLLGSLQLSAEPQHRSRRAPPPAPPSSLPARSNTLRELLCPPRLGLTVLVRGTGPPLPTRGSSHSPSPPLPSPPTPPPSPPRHCRARLPPAACDLLPIPSRDQEGECHTGPQGGYFTAQEFLLTLG